MLAALIIGTRQAKITLCFILLPCSALTQAYEYFCQNQVLSQAVQHLSVSTERKELAAKIASADGEHTRVENSYHLPSRLNYGPPYNFPKIA